MLFFLKIISIKEKQKKHEKHLYQTDTEKHYHWCYCFSDWGNILFYFNNWFESSA